MRILFVGDVVGRAGRKIVIDKLPELRERYKADFVILNGENAAGGFGITEQILLDFQDAGADVVTTGNHVWDQRETLVFIERHPELLRPLNYPEQTPGNGSGIFQTKDGRAILVINAMGRVFMNELDCPFTAIDHQLELCELKKTVDAIFVDFHAEATSEKQAMGHFLDGRISCIVGTHTHVPTSDDQILRGGSGYMSDAGMCGDYDSVLGMDKQEPVNRFVSRIPGGRFQPASGNATFCGLAIETDDMTGLTKHISPVRLGGKLRPIEPPFWLE